MKELIKKLTEVWGPSGYEHRIRELIRAEVTGLADEITVDPLGNLICRVGKGGAKVMVAAHMDEIGVMVTFAEKSGFLRFSNIGGLIFTALRGNRVRFEDGTLGVIGVHTDSGEAHQKVSGLEEFYIDVQDGIDAALPPIGRPAGFWRETELRGDRVIAKALDDRIGCVIAIEAMRRLNHKTPNEVYFVFTVQEEVGLYGAKTSAYTVAPDVALSLDVTGAGDLPHGTKMAVRLGDGAAIKVRDGRHIVPPTVVKWMRERAEADGIPYQLEVLPGGTTDAAEMQVARAGVPSGCISIPCRYVHTVSETVDLGDVQAGVDLLSGLLSHPA